MATWARLSASLRNIVRNVSSNRSIWYGGTVGVGMLGYVVASGYVRCKYQPQCKFWPHVVYAAEDAKVKLLQYFYSKDKVMPYYIFEKVKAPTFICLFDKNRYVYSR